MFDLCSLFRTKPTKNGRTPIGHPSVSKLINHAAVRCRQEMAADGNRSVPAAAATAAAATTVATTTTAPAAATTTTEATTATATTTAATATTTAVPTTATTTWAIFTRLGLVDGQGTAIVFLAIEGCDCGLGLIVGPHLDESKSLAAAGFPVADDFSAGHGAVLREQLFQIRASR
jgi:hypothetical protein